MFFLEAPYANPGRKKRLVYDPPSHATLESSAPSSNTTLVVWRIARRYLNGDAENMCVFHFLYVYGFTTCQGYFGRYFKGILLSGGLYSGPLIIANPIDASESEAAERVPPSTV